MSPTAVLDPQACYRAAAGRDARFDGRFYLAVTSTGIYCRPSCPARTPRYENCRFFRTAAAASAAGFRACKRCRPDTAPGTRHADPLGDLAHRALRLIADGGLDTGGVPELAARLAVSERTLRRTLVDRVGASPQQIARVRRAQAARALLEETDLPVADVAYAAGFGSIRQFNDVVAAELGMTPGEVRARRRATPGRPSTRREPPDRTPIPAGTLTLRLRYRPPLAIEPLRRFLAAHAIDGLEQVTPTEHARLVVGPAGPHEVRVSWPDATATPTGALAVRLALADLRDLRYVVAAVRRWLDLDADPDLVDGALAMDPQLAPLVAARPGLRVPGGVDGWEIAAFAVLGQQVSLAAGRTFAGRLVAAFGEPTDRYAGLRAAFPTPERLAAAGPDALRAATGLTRVRARTLHALATAVAGGLDLSGGADRERVRAELLALPGVGPWTATLVELRALRNPDAFPAADLVARRALGGLSTREAARRAEAWRPWRGYALMHLWTKEAFA